MKKAKSKVPRAVVLSRGANRPNYYLHKFKCMNCGLHFAMYSWDETLQVSDLWCPECHRSLGGNKEVWRPAVHEIEPRYRFIFEELKM